MKLLNEAGNNLGAGLQLGLFLPVRRQDFRFDLAGVVPLIAFTAVMVLSMAYLLPDPPRRFSPYGLAQFLAANLLVVAAGLILERRAGSPFARGGLIVPLLAALPTVWVAYTLWVWVGRKQGWSEFWPVDALFLLWVFFLAVRAFRVGFGADLARAKLLAAPLVAVVLGLFWLLPFWGFWYQGSSTGSAGTARPRINVEATYYAQSKLLDDTLSKLAPQRPGVVDLYFVGFGGDADQDVFMKEVTAARELFERRFDAAGRSLVLVNNAKTVEALPIASVSNLQRTLEELGRIMDPTEDLLFLFLTSHGSKDHRLAVDFWPLRLNRLSRYGLADMLADSGIRNQVVVVSACYSGGFVEALSGPHSLVLTAARADRTSFGCSNKRDWTYFGQAYFGEALESHRSFIAAFHAARETVEGWEATKLISTSEPQISVGAAIGPLLEAFEARLNAASQGQATARQDD